MIFFFEKKNSENPSTKILQIRVATAVTIITNIVTCRGGGEYNFSEGNFPFSVKCSYSSYSYSMTSCSNYKALYRKDICKRKKMQAGYVTKWPKLVELFKIPKSFINFINSWLRLCVNVWCPHCSPQCLPRPQR